MKKRRQVRNKIGDYLFSNEWWRMKGFYFDPDYTKLFLELKKYLREKT